MDPVLQRGDGKVCFYSFIFIVIANAVKQSRMSVLGALDRFAALAMTFTWIICDHLRNLRLKNPLARERFTFSAINRAGIYRAIPARFP
jgi:hypothetical protein